jgi:hypothetical protein
MGRKKDARMARQQNLWYFITFFIALSGQPHHVTFERNLRTDLPLIRIVHTS